MKVSNVNNRSSFGSKVRINQSLSDLVMSYSYQRQVLLKNVQKLEKNGIDDFVILSGKSKIDKYDGYQDIIKMQVVEKKDDGYYITRIPVENKLNQVDKNSLLRTTYNISNMYIQAKENMRKLSQKYNKFIQYW